MTSYPPQLDVSLKNGVVLIGSDAHIWPGGLSTALKAFIKFCKELKPKIVIMNGDVLDLPQISRHQPIGWFLGPKVHEELEIAQYVMLEIERSVGEGVKKLWTIGNHEKRMDSRLASTLPQLEKIKGFSLADHFPEWKLCWSVVINEEVLVKHRFKSGINAPRNNALWSGGTTVTGHLHSQIVDPLTDFFRTRYGVDTGCLADTKAPAFEYTENNPKNWRSGFSVLTFVGGQLLPPELVTVWSPSSVVFRGKIIRV